MNIISASFDSLKFKIFQKRIDELIVLRLILPEKEKKKKKNYERV